MRIRKKKKFNAFVVRKTEILLLLSSLISISIISVILSCFNNKISIGAAKIILSNEISLIKNSKAKIDAENLFNLQNVLASSLPILNINTDTDNTSYIKNSPVLTTTEALPKPIPKNTFPIKTTQTISKNLQLRNQTTYEPDINKLLLEPLNFKSPEILIVHTHASESYKKDDLNYYSENDSDRDLDTSVNVVRVGEELANELRKYGFKVTHAKEINDYPSYNKSYIKTLEVINYYLRENPNIQIVLDIHRDSAVQSDGTKLKFLSKVNNENVAQLMIVCGTNQAGLDNDTWQENLKFAVKLQNFMELNYPGLSRPLNLRQERFNTHTTLGSMIIEVGTSGNTLQESLNSTKYLAKTIKEVLSPYN